MTLFSKTSPGRLLLKLIYWNKSVQVINIIITTNEQPGTSLNNGREIPKLWMRRWILMTAIRRMCNFKKVNITLWSECFLDSCLDIVRTYSFCFGTSAEKSPWTKTYCTENCLNTSILWIFFFLIVVSTEMGYQYVLSRTH